MNKTPNRNSPEYKAKRNEYARRYYREKYKAKQIEMKNRRRVEMRIWYQELRSHLKCSRCPEDTPCCIDFHHERDKEFNLYEAVNLGYGKERILAEIAKCIPLCANCHRKHHDGE